MSMNRRWMTISCASRRGQWEAWHELRVAPSIVDLHFCRWAIITYYFSRICRWKYNLVSLDGTDRSCWCKLWHKCELLGNRDSMSLNSIHGNLIFVIPIIARLLFLNFILQHPLAIQLQPCRHNPTSQMPFSLADPNRYTQLAPIP